jgi:hypothetical protein
MAAHSKEAIEKTAGEGGLKNGSASWTRTNDQAINSRLLYQLSYRGSRG